MSKKKGFRIPQNLCNQSAEVVAEQALIASVFIEPEIFPLAQAQLGSAVPLITAHRAIWLSMCQIAQTHDLQSVIDPVMITTTAKSMGILDDITIVDPSNASQTISGVNAVDALSYSTGNPASIEGYTDLIVRGYRKALTTHALQRGQRRVASVGSASEIDTIMSEILGELVEGQHGDGYITGGNASRDTMARYDLLASGESNGSAGLSTGLPDLDAKGIGLGVGGEITSLLGLPSNGKSKVLTQFVGQLLFAHRQRVLVVINETTYTRFMEALASGLAGVSLAKVAKGELDADEYTRYKAWHSKIELSMERRDGEVDLHILHAESASPATIRQKVAQLASERPVDTIALDWLQNMSPDPEDARLDNTRLIERNMKKLKSLALSERLNGRQSLHVLLAAQAASHVLNYADRTPNMEDAAGSKEVGKLSTTVLGCVDYESLAIKEPDNDEWESKRNMAKIRVAKNRATGARGDVFLQRPDSIYKLESLQHPGINPSVLF